MTADDASNETKTLSDIADECSYGYYKANIPAPAEWVIGNVLEKGSIGLLYSPPECGKGFFSLQLSIELAYGNAPFGITEWKPTKPVRTIYLSNEDGKNTIHRRLHGIWDNKQANGDEIEGIDDMVHYFGLDSPRFLFGVAENDVYDTTFFCELLQLLDRLHEAREHIDLIILDNLSSFFGDVHDQSPFLHKAFLRLSSLCSSFNVSILILHHTRKLDSASKDPRHLFGFYDQQLSQNSARGSSKILASVRAAISMIPFQKSYSEALNLPNAMGFPNGKYIGVRVAKNSNGIPQEDHIFCRETNGVLTRTDFRHEIDKKEPRNGSGESRRTKDIENAETFMGYIKNGFRNDVSYTKTEVIKNTNNCNRRKGGPADRAFQILLDHGCVELTTDDKNREKVRFLRDLALDG
jgi:hypothetical protein